MYYLAPHQTMMIVINCIALLLGTPGNILILRVYFGKPRKTSTHILIMGLALSDLISLCFTFPLEIVSWSKEYQMEGGQAFCRLTSFFYHYFSQCSVLITVAIAIDRYNAVCRPHQWKITTARAQGVVASCFLLSAPSSVASLFSYGVKTVDVSTDSVHGEAGNMNDRVNITLCSRDRDSGFNNVAFILHTIWFVLLFVVLTVAYTRIYLTIRKRVNAGVGTKEEGDPSRMRVVRPVIRFISHLAVVTNRAGSANTTSLQHTVPENSSPIDGAAVELEQETRSTDGPLPNTPVQPEKSNPPNRDEKPSLLTGNSNNAFARALLLAGEMPHRPVLPSINKAGEAESGEAEHPKEDQDKMADSSAVKPRTSLRTTTAWNKIKPKVIATKDSGGQAPVPAPLAKVLQKRAVATAMNVKMQKKTTNMLLVAALTAVLTWFPALVIEVSIPDVHEWLLEQSDWLQVLTCFMGWLFLFNFVTNPFVYSLMNSRFREDCSKSFRECKLCRNKTTAVQQER